MKEKNIKETIIPLLLLFILTQKSLQKPPRPDFRLAFGSCFKHDTLSVPGSEIIFRAIKDTKSDAFLWLGDYAYTDKREYIIRHTYNTMENIKKIYMNSYNDPCKKITK